MAISVLALGTILRDIAIFAVATFGLGAALAPRKIADPVLRLTTGIALALGGAFIVGFIGFAAGLSNPACALTVAATTIAVVGWRRRPTMELLREPRVSGACVAWLIFAGWSLGLLALVESYSGGGWAADWVEHWQRTIFFLDRQPLETQFAAIYPLTARPPLANLLIALWLEAGRHTFAEFQVYLTLFGSLVALPAAVLVRRWSAAPAVLWWLVLVLMLNPMVAQNVTFAWTKLPTAFFVLAAIALLAHRRDQPARVAVPLTGACLAFGVLTHYSAAPWVIAIAVAHFWTLRKNRSAALLREFTWFVATIAIIVGLWVGWAVAHFGWHGAATANTTAGAWQAQTPLMRITTPLRNLVDTLVPFPVRGEPADGLIDQISRLGRLRDVAFNVYQLNLLLAFGLSGLWILAERGRTRQQASIRIQHDECPNRTFFAVLIPLAAVLGVVVHTPRDEWGLAHICLQPLVVLGLAWIAAQLSTAAVRTRVVWGALAAVDFILGIGLHFGIESGALAPAIIPPGASPLLPHFLARAAAANAADKAAFHLTFFADQLHAPWPLVTLWLALCIASIILGIRRLAPRAA